MLSYTYIGYLIFLRSDKDKTNSFPILRRQPNSVKSYEHIFCDNYVNHSQNYGALNYVPAYGHTAGAHEGRIPYYCISSLAFCK
jgi:hypothetical protein